MNIRKALKNPLYSLRIVTWKACNKTKLLNKISDEKIIKFKYRLMLNKSIDLNNPQTFTEKIQWLKLHDRKPEYTMMVDKYHVKEYIKKTIGPEYVVPVYGVWDSFDEIDFDTLPKEFVLKCNHDSGGLIICPDKAKLNKEEARKKITSSLKRDFYWVGREWPYKNVRKKIFAEKYLCNRDGSDLVDYKFYCFNGEPRFLYISKDLTHHTNARISYLTLNWKNAKFYRKDYKQFEVLPKKPDTFDKMIEFARILAKGIPFIRVDFYEIDGKLFFGELTFSPGSGFTEFYPYKWEEYWGKEIDINIVRNQNEKHN